MTEIIIYEGMMCCSTGLCGPEPDQKLIEFNDAMDRLKAENANVKRLNLSAHITLFQDNKEIMQVIQKEGVKVLPLVCAGGKIVMKQKYPSYDELKNFTDRESE